ncbi:MAG: FtsQ-type POTRA domain-containing protein [Acaryochloridaceae cyanobacterium RL_2_7]|nr:FtsQ-type POTRA domain-containing protein [Acaryochloridaceae cyanobacterium RL_2_7]
MEDWSDLWICVGVGLGLSQPEWKIRSLSQIKVLGNTQLSTETLERLIPVTYPSSLIRIQPRKIAQQLTTYAHVERVTISRQLFPPRVNIVVQEREPVAIAKCNECTLVYDGQALFGQNNLWLIDAEGVVLPQISYPNIDPKTLPTLEIDGYLHPPSDNRNFDEIPGRPVTTSSQQKRRLQLMLPLLIKSPVAIQKVDWRDPKNLQVTRPTWELFIWRTQPNNRRG